MNLGLAGRVALVCGASRGLGRAVAEELALGRLAEPAEFAGLAAFLVSDRAGYITGSAFAVDGGWLRSV